MILETYQVKRHGEYVDVPFKNENNIIEILKDNEIELYYDVILRRIFIDIGNGVEELRDYHSIRVRDLLLKYGIDVNKQFVDNYLDSISNRNHINYPLLRIKERYELEKESFSLNVDIIKDMYDCLSVENETELSYKMFRRWIIQGISCLHNDCKKIKSENVLTLQGKQGVMKTTFLKNICPYENYFKDSVKINASNKDSVSKSTSYWIVELGELDATLKGEQSEIKAFLSETVDDVRTPYDRYSTKNPRYTTFCASVNKYQFLKDETGSRRFWIIAVNGIDIKKQKTIDLERFWAYAYYLYINKLEINYLDSEDTKEMQDQNFKFNEINECDLFIEEMISKYAETINNTGNVKVQFKDLYKQSIEFSDKITVKRLCDSISKYNLKETRPGNKKTIHFPCIDSNIEYPKIEREAIENETISIETYRKERNK